MDIKAKALEQVERAKMWNARPLSIGARVLLFIAIIVVLKLVHVSIFR